MAFGKCGPCPVCHKQMKYQGGQCRCDNDKCPNYLVEQPALKSQVKDLPFGSEES